jgi:N-sulfoglucosamine sulfohydrolase
MGKGHGLPRYPNILYLHSHDTGRYVQPYGHQVPTPNIQRLADQGILFRQAFSAAATCSGSRAALLTGQYPHVNGMTGLAHRGWSLHDTTRHLVHTLRDAGYHSALIGEQHVSADPAELGYDHVAELGTTRVHDVAPAARELLSDGLPEPFFLSVGFFETHREYFEPSSVRDALYSLPPAHLPDTPETRRDMASFKASARALDQGVGAVLEALDGSGRGAATLVILTTDHGLAVPGAKGTLYDRGLGVLLVMRGPGGFTGGTVSDALVSQVDLFPTMCELAGLDAPDWLHGRSLLPLVRGEAQQVNDEIFAEITYHAAYEPQRAIRTPRWKYIRRFDGPRGPVLANVDDSPTKEAMLERGWGDRAIPAEQLFDLAVDPGEGTSLVNDPALAPIRDDLRSRLEGWMADTADPLLDGPVTPPPGGRINRRDQRSASEPTGSSDGELVAAVGASRPASPLATAAAEVSS